MTRTVTNLELFTHFEADHLKECVLFSTDHQLDLLDDEMDHRFYQRIAERIKASAMRLNAKVDRLTIDTKK